MENSGARTFREFTETTIAAGETLHVGEAVDAARLCRIIRDEERGRNRMVTFDRIEGFDERLAGNVFGTQERIHRSVGAGGREDFFARIDRAVSRPRRLVEKAADFERHADPALTRGRVPLVVHSEDDGAPYITSGVVLARHPESGRHHLCFVRLAIVGDDVLLFNGVTPRIRDIVACAREAGAPLDVLILIGAPPQVLLSGALSLPDAVDELEVAQAWAGDGLSFTPGRLPVPNGTEMVLFGQVLAECRDEGPFGDSFGTYSTRRNPICRVSEVWQRKDPIYHMLLGGVSNEHIELLVLKAMHALEHVKARWTALKSYTLPAFAGGRLCILCVEEDHDADRYLPMLFAVPLVRMTVLINSDVDPGSGDDVLWALTRRTAGAKSFRFQEGSGTGKVVIDATERDLADWNRRRIGAAKRTDPGE